MKIAKRTAARNEAFASASKAKKASMIASDVIAQLNAARYVAETGTYFSMSLGSEAEGLDSLQDLLVAENASCTVCAIGSAFASCVRLANKVKVQDLAVNPYRRLSVEVSREGSDSHNTMYQSLEAAFTESELDAMEVCFELRNVNANFSYREMKTFYDSAIYKRCAKLDSSSTRMAAVMKHIIKNSGRFVVKGLKLAPNNPDKE